jgi:hypothetical protein
LQNNAPASVCFEKLLLLLRRARREEARAPGIAGGTRIRFVGKQALGGGNGHERAIPAAVHNREEAFRQRIVDALPGFAGIIGSQQSAALQRDEQRAGGAGGILKLQVVEVGAIPVAARISRYKKPRVRGNEQRLVVDAVQPQVPRRNERQVFGVPMRTLVAGIQQVVARDSPELRSVRGNFERLRLLLQERIGACILPGRSAVMRNENSACGRRKPCLKTMSLTTKAM